MKRYNDYNSYLKEIFGQRVQKIPIDGGFNCPNRDGTISDKGCIYCDSRGSGSGAFIEQGLSVDEQIERGRSFAKKKYNASKFIAYFQAFTSTYGPIDRLKDLYDRALSYEGMVGLSVGTRPDCVNREVLSLVSSYIKDYLVWLELGLQSSHDETLSLINRGHDVSCFEAAVNSAHAFGLNVCAHVILGLPGETKEMMLETARFLATLPLAGLKVHMQFVVKGTALESLYKKGEYICLEQKEYIDIVTEFIERLPPHLIMQRLTGDPVRSDLAAPMWAMSKTENVALIKEELERRDTWQGKLWDKKSSAGR